MIQYPLLHNCWAAAGKPQAEHTIILSTVAPLQKKTSHWHFIESSRCYNNFYSNTALDHFAKGLREGYMPMYRFSETQLDSKDSDRFIAIHVDMTGIGF